MMYVYMMYVYMYINLTNTLRDYLLTFTLYSYKSVIKISINCNSEVIYSLIEKDPNLKHYL